MIINQCSSCQLAVVGLSVSPESLNVGSLDVKMSSMRGTLVQLADAMLDGSYPTINGLSVVGTEGIPLTPKNCLIGEVIGSLSFGTTQKIQKGRSKRDIAEIPAKTLENGMILATTLSSALLSVAILREMARETNARDIGPGGRIQMARAEARLVKALALPVLLAEVVELVVIVSQNELLFTQATETIVGINGVDRVSVIGTNVQSVLDTRYDQVAATLVDNTPLTISDVPSQLSTMGLLGWFNSGGSVLRLSRVLPAILVIPDRIRSLADADATHVLGLVIEFAKTYYSGPAETAISSAVKDLVKILKRIGLQVSSVDSSSRGVSDYFSFIGFKNIDEGWRALSVERMLMNGRLEVSIKGRSGVSGDRIRKYSHWTDVSYRSWPSDLRTSSLTISGDSLVNSDVEITFDFLDDADAELYTPRYIMDGYRGVGVADSVLLEMRGHISILFAILFTASHAQDPRAFLMSSTISVSDITPIMNAMGIRYIMPKGAIIWQR